mgnify:CR=1 FL=1
MNENNWLMNYGDIDIFWNENCKDMDKIDNVTIITQGEGGFTTMLMANAIIENDNCKRIGTILSKYHTVDAFNIIPKTADVGWPVYKINDSLIIRITSWYPLVFAPNANPSAWIYSYPIIKSLVEMLKGLEVRNIEYICSGEQMSELKNSNSFFIKGNNRWARIIPAWADQDKEPTDIFASTPSWAIPYIANLMGVSCNVSCVINQDGTIDEQKKTAIDFFKWFNKGVGHWDIDVTKKGIGQKTIEKNVKELKELQSELKLNKPIYKKPDEGVMFG